jgi:hypothetical protein
VLLLDVHCHRPRLMPLLGQAQRAPHRPVWPAVDKLLFLEDRPDQRRSGAARMNFGGNLNLSQLISGTGVFDDAGGEHPRACGYRI